jgi:hypothetical protein
MKLYGIKVLEIFQEELELGNFFNIYIYKKDFHVERRKKMMERVNITLMSNMYLLIASRDLKLKSLKTNENKSKAQQK